MRVSKLTSSDVKKCRANHVMPRQCMPMQGSECDLLNTIAISACLLCQNVDVHMRQTRISRLVANNFTIIQRLSMSAAPYCRRLIPNRGNSGQRTTLLGPFDLIGVIS